MKIQSIFNLALAALLAATSVHAATYFWDDNAADTGFGTAGASTGTWAGPTTGPTAGWSLSGTGANVFAGFTTVASGTADTLNFGTNTAGLGLGAGTITVAGAVSANSITYGSQSGAILLSGGTSITLGGTTPTITVNNAQNFISTRLLGSAGLVKVGSGELDLNGTGNSFSGGANGVGIHLTGGTLTVSGGTTAVTGGTNGLGTYSAENGNFKQTGGTVTVAGDLIVGWNSNSTFTLSGGTTTAANLRHQDGAAGVITISGTNTTTVGSVSHTTGGGGTDSLTVNLNTGGTLAANSLGLTLSGSALTGGNHSLNVNFDGGTLKARSTGNLIAATPAGTSTRAINVLVKTNGAKFDSNGVTATILQPLLHDPALGASPDGGLTLNDTAVTKGTLLLSDKANTYTGATTIVAGTLRVGALGVNIANHSFENTVVPISPGYIYNPTGADWTFNTQSGIARSVFFSTPPPDGLQAGFMQDNGGSISQSINLLQDGLYKIAFQAQGRGGAAGPNGIILKLDGNPAGTWAHTEISQTLWLGYESQIFLTAGSHTLAFQGNNTATGDKSSSIDNVRMYQSIGTLPTATAVNLTTAGATLDLNSTTQTIGSLTGVAGTSVINGNLIIGGTDTTTFAGVISGSGSSLSITGGGNQTLSGANTYSGPTTVSDGTLAVNGSLANTATLVTSATSARLQGSGLIIGPVTIGSNGTLAAGNSIESLGGGALTLNDGSTFEQEIANNTAAGADLFYSSGTLSLSGAVTLNLINITDPYAWQPSDKITLISYTGTPSLVSKFSYVTAPGGDLDEGDTFTYDGAQWVLNYQDTTPGENYKTDALIAGTKFVTMTVVPEAGTAGLLALGLLLLRRLRRR